LEKRNGLSFALYDLDHSKSIFSEIEKNTIHFGFNKRPLKPTTLSGAMFQDQWYVPQAKVGCSLYKRCPRSLFMADTKGTGGPLRWY
jgi:iron complex transport system substrate-binding protein